MGLCYARIRMKSCSYCGASYPDEVMVCPVDRHPLGEPAATKRKVNCPHCGSTDDYTFTVEARGSFNLPVFVLGGIFAVMFRNAGRARRVRCNKCDARFYVRSRLSQVSRILFWLLIAPGLVWLLIVVAGFIRMFFLR